MSKYGKERKVIIIPLTNRDPDDTQIFSINDYSVVFRFNEPTTLKAGIIEHIKKSVVISRGLKSEFDATTGKTKQTVVEKRDPRYKVIELSGQSKDSKEIEDTVITKVETKGSISDEGEIIPDSVTEEKTLVKNGDEVLTREQIPKV